MKALDAPSAKAGLAALGESHGRITVVAGILRAKTSVNNEWIISLLALGHQGPASRILSAGRADKDLSIKRNALMQILCPAGKSTR